MLRYLQDLSTISQSHGGTLSINWICEFDWSFLKIRFSAERIVRKENQTAPQFITREKDHIRYKSKWIFNALKNNFKQNNMFNYEKNL